MSVGKVFLVGAGPGDPGLITVKGRDCIAKADVVVYDRLASPRLLTFARSDAELVYAGKHPRHHVWTQDQINSFLVEQAEHGKVVCRLKGGDPSVFGRVGEEAQVLASRGIDFEIVPGISSAIAVPAYAGIPVTYRGVSPSFTVVAGHREVEGDPASVDWHHVARSGDTLVFLMGVTNLDVIVEQLTKNGRSPQTPVAVIRWGTTPEQQTVVGVLSDIVEVVHRHEITNPAVVVVGEVVRLREQLAWYEKRPFFGRRIVVTRTSQQAGELSRKIESLGGEAYEFPVIETVAPEDLEPLDRALQTLSSYDWVIFTSVNAVAFFFQRMQKLKLDIRTMRARIAVVGTKTQETLDRYGIQAEFTPSEFNGDVLAQELATLLQMGNEKQTILFPRADIARTVILDTLRREGHIVDEVDVYQTRPLQSGARELFEQLQAGRIHVITFSSSSTVTHFVSAMNGHNWRDYMDQVEIACIGPITAQTARDLGLTPTIIASHSTIDGLMNQMIVHFSTTEE